MEYYKKGNNNDKSICVCVLIHKWNYILGFLSMFRHRLVIRNCCQCCHCVCLGLNQGQKPVGLVCVIALSTKHFHMYLYLYLYLCYCLLSNNKQIRTYLPFPLPYFPFKCGFDNCFVLSLSFKLIDFMELDIILRQKVIGVE